MAERGVLSCRGERGVADWRLRALVSPEVTAALDETTRSRVEGRVGVPSVASLRAAKGGVVEEGIAACPMGCFEVLGDG